MKFSAFTLARIVWLLMLLGFGSVATSAEKNAPRLSRPAMVNTNLDSFNAAFPEPDAEVAAAGSAAVSFGLYVSRKGQAFPLPVLHATTNSKPLQAFSSNVVRRLRFQPALYKGKPVGVQAVATVVLIAGEKPVILAELTTSTNDIANPVGAVAPQRIRPTELPRYPRKALMQGNGGTVIYSATVDPNGTVTNAKILSSNANESSGLYESVLRNARNAKFVPGWRNGAPTTSDFVGEWTFMIQ